MQIFFQINPKIENILQMPSPSLAGSLGYARVDYKKDSRVWSVHFRWGDTIICGDHFNSGGFFFF